MQQVQLDENDKKGKVYLGNIDSPKAAMTYSRAGTKLMIIDHTEVSEDFRGQGLGRVLLEAVVNLARERQAKIVPLCPYAKSVFDKEESLRDVLQ